MLVDFIWYWHRSSCCAKSALWPSIARGVAKLNRKTCSINTGTSIILQPKSECFTM